MTTEHVSFEQLCDLVDGVSTPVDVDAMQRHLDRCAACQETLARLRDVLDRAASLAPHIEPPDDAWRLIHGRLSQARRTDRTRSRFAESWITRVAAAILLVAGSSTLTIVALRSGESGSRARAPAISPGAAATPAALRAVDDSYVGVVEELTTTLRAQRGSLAPETVATLERSLRIIDEAIAEARAALAADPRNGALLDVLSGNYEQKVELLRRASELAART